MPKKRQKPSTARQDIYGTLYAPAGKRGRRPSQIYPGEFSRYEIAAIGAITVSWAYLEHVLLLRTAELCERAKLDLPPDALSLSFERRLGALRGLARTAVQDDWEREKLVTLLNRISNVQNDRHKITHGLWQWDLARPEKLTVYSFLRNKEYEAAVDHAKMVKLIEVIGEINFELAHPPRRGLRKLKLPNSRISRRAAIEWSGGDAERLGF